MSFRGSCLDPVQIGDQHVAEDNRKGIDFSPTFLHDRRHKKESPYRLQRLQFENDARWRLRCLEYVKLYRHTIFICSSHQFVEVKVEVASTVPDQKGENESTDLPKAD